MPTKLPAPLPVLALGAFGAAFLAGRSLRGGGAAATPAAATGPSTADGNAALTDPFGYSLDTAGIDFSHQPAGTLTGVDPFSQGSGADSGGLPGGGSTTPAPLPNPNAVPAPAPAPIVTPAPHYYAQVTVATNLWNDGTGKWVYNGANVLKIGTRLVIRAAQYTKGGVRCYPIVAGTAYGGYWVPVAHVKLLGLAP